MLPLAGESSLAIDADAVRRRLGAWVATQAASERSGLEAAWRDGLVVADRILSLARTMLGAGGTPLWQVEVPLPADLHGLGGVAGLPSRALHRTIEALIAAEVLDGVSQIGRERVVRVRPEALADAPVLAAVRWEVVHTLLRDADTPIARLIVRELARRTTAEARARGHFVSASQRDLAEAAGYSKASMRRHLDALIASGVILSRARDRTNSWHRLQPVIFEAGTSAPLDPDGAIARAGPTARGPHAPPSVGSEASAVARPRRGPAGPTPDLARETARHPAVDPGGVLPSPDPARSDRPAPQVAPGLRPVEAALTVEVNGVRVALPAGVALSLEQDEAGAMWYRAGALRLGPIRFT